MMLKRQKTLRGWEKLVTFLGHKTLRGLRIVVTLLEPEVSENVGSLG